jgi:hypothetical protein
MSQAPLTEAQLDAITEAACRYFCGWKPKDPPRPAKSHEPFRRKLVAILGEPQCDT